MTPKAVAGGPAAPNASASIGGRISLEWVARGGAAGASGNFMRIRPTGPSSLSTKCRDKAGPKAGPVAPTYREPGEMIPALRSYLGAERLPPSCTAWRGLYATKRPDGRPSWISRCGNLSGGCARLQLAEPQPLAEHRDTSTDRPDLLIERPGRGLNLRCLAPADRLGFARVELLPLGRSLMSMPLTRAPAMAPGPVNGG